MNIVLNGEPKAVSASTIDTLVQELALNSRQVAIERNGAIVPRSTYGEAKLFEGDTIEIVAFIGGG